MVYPRLDVLDPNDADSIQVSFNDRDGSVNPRGVKCRLGPVRFGVETGIKTFEPSTVPGGDVVSHRDGIWRSAAVIYPEADSPGALNEFYGVLSALMVQKGQMAYQEDESSDLRFVDYLKSPRFPFLRGQHAYDLSRDPDGTTIEFLQRPGLREAERAAALNLWSNASLLMGATTPTGWTSEAGTHTIEATEAFRIVHNADANLVRRDATLAAATQVTFSVYARKVSGARTVEIQLISRASDALLDTATVTGDDFTRYEVSGAVAGGDTGVRVRIRYQGGSGSTITEFRDAQLETGTLVASAFRTGPEPVSNNPATGRSFVISNPGKMWAPYRLNIAAESGDTPRIEEILVSLRAGNGIDGNRDLVPFLNTTGHGKLDATAGGWTVTLGADTASVADSEASGGNAAECTYAVTETFAKRVRVTRTAFLDSLRGYYKVILHARATAAGFHKIGLRSAPSLADPVPYVNPIFEFDESDATSWGYEDIDLGVFYLSEDPTHTLGGLALEFWSELVSGTGNLRFDSFSLLAVDGLFDDRVSVLSIPGSSKDSWLGKELVVPTVPTGSDPGTVINNRIRLNQTDEAAGTPPVEGFPWPVGRHKITFIITGRGQLDFQCRVWNITDDTNAVFRTFTGRNPAKLKTVTIQFDSVAAKSYQPQLVFTGALVAGEYLDIKRIRHAFTPYLGASEQMRTEPLTALLEKLDSAGNVLSYLGLAGEVPLWAPPGNSLVTAFPRDVKKHSGAVELESKITRDVLMSPSGAPRWPV